MRATRREFEKHLARRFAGVRLTRQTAVENTLVDGQPKILRTSLYYHTGAHVASWGNGRGWFIEVTP